MATVEAGLTGDFGQRPLPNTIEEGWEHYVDAIVFVSNVPDESYLIPLDQDLMEEVGLTSLQLNDGRETLNNAHGIEIPAELDKAKWPKTVADMFRKYLRYTPALADLEAHPDHELFSRTGQGENLGPVLGTNGLELATG